MENPSPAGFPTSQFQKGSNLSRVREFRGRIGTLFTDRRGWVLYRSSQFRSTGEGQFPWPTNY